MKQILCAAIGLYGLACVLACRTVSVSPTLPVDPPSTPINFLVELPKGATAEIDGRLWKPDRARHQNIVVVRVPSGGLIPSSTMLWTRAMTDFGYSVLTYDKRARGYVADIHEEGPVALSRDVDAACRAVVEELGSRVRIILWTDTQGTQVVLSSKCAQKQASALVFVAPITDRIDHFWVEGLFQSGQHQRARNLRATFESIEQGLFPPDAKVMGMTLKYWKSWVSLTNKTASLFNQIHVPVLFLVGEKDDSFPTRAMPIVKNLSKKPERKYLVLPEADHHLLQEGVLRPETTQAVLTALVSLIKRD